MAPNVTRTNEEVLERERGGVFFVYFVLFLFGEGSFGKDGAGMRGGYGGTGR